MKNDVKNLQELYLLIKKDKLLTEVLNNPYNYEYSEELSKKSYGLNAKVFVFYPNLKNRNIFYSIDFSGKENLEIVFYYNNLDENKTRVIDITNTGDQFKVFSTIIKIIKDILPEYLNTIEQITFFSQDKSRTRFYLNRIVPIIGNIIEPNHNFIKNPEGNNWKFEMESVEKNVVYFYFFKKIKFSN
jgi:hypothetical protein